MPGNLLAPKMFRNKITITALAATANSAAFDMGVGDCYQLTLDITAATGTSPTLDVVVQTSFDNGTNFLDLPLRFTQVTAASTKYLVFKLGLGGNEVALEQAAADTGGTLAKNCIFDPHNMRLKYTVGGTNPSFTGMVNTAVLPRSSQAQY
jgi:hypothetical protein